MSSDNIDNETPADEEDEDVEDVDAWDIAVDNSGCKDAYLAMNECYWDKHDWRKCTKEVMEFRKCWEKLHGPLPETGIKPR
ncbi:respiratory chain complex assembly protein [Schizosaccharomyces japonicus yFS275]|uniref:Respiratory chain complex assembly protein n=1 Tax=Schizosaccharomyces japonicus (strain yFS275 / FY16936) TaxID=402676 RepID=B6K5Z0_SCHJY|nr:respiratory chain complex assembly protein [Schizosaccharomyces japonicus yFS275]EEB08944.1 respiratory chain complex assembly protein [Schizosaccharomyces japonicus yFS275]